MFPTSRIVQQAGATVADSTNQRSSTSRHRNAASGTVRSHGKFATTKDAPKADEG